MVLDTSIVFPLLVDEENSLKAREVYAENEDIVFLDFLRIELANDLASSLRRRLFRAVAVLCASLASA